uniref:Uncharacterized protein n=1 Tax=Cacopsylla melanoneura TaxID=428564 RepID=A0A8D8Q904_9HEMI
MVCLFPVLIVVASSVYTLKAYELSKNDVKDEKRILVTTQAQVNTKELGNHPLYRIQREASPDILEVENQKYFIKTKENTGNKDHFDRIRREASYKLKEENRKDFIKIKENTRTNRLHRREASSEIQVENGNRLHEIKTGEDNNKHRLNRIPRGIADDMEEYLEEEEVMNRKKPSKNLQKKKPEALGSGFGKEKKSKGKAKKLKAKRKLTRETPKPPPIVNFLR